MPSKKLVWDPQHWRFRAEETRTVADQMTHEEARAIMRRIAIDYDRLMVWRPYNHGALAPRDTMFGVPFRPRPGLPVAEITFAAQCRRGRGFATVSL
jgi:hypothetical protein